MTTYKLCKYNGKNVSVTKYNDGVFECAIPFDLANTDYQEFVQWCEQGNTPLPADEV
jgi:hypothetical protein